MAIERIQEKPTFKDFEKAIEEELSTTPSVKENKEDSGSDLANVVREKYDEAKKNRKEMEEVWMENLRQFKGIYSPEVLSRLHPNRSKAFVRLTRTKVKTVDSRLSDFILPVSGERNWSLNPTPIAEVAPALRQEIAQQLAQQVQDPRQITPEMLENATQKEADARAEKMGTTIEDQLVNIKYRETMKDVLHCGNLHGTGVLKGPMVDIKERTAYQMDAEGNWNIDIKDDVYPYIKSVGLWDFYPDMSATDVQDCSYIIERHRPNKHELLQLADRSDFDSDAIYAHVKEQEEGDSKEENYDVELRTLGNSPSKDSSSTDKYELIEFWGYLDSKELEQAGIKIPENKKGAVSIPACVWVLGNQVVKGHIHPIEGAGWPYYLYYYDKDETSIYGEGIASIMRDVQELVNASFRGMLDNAAISAGPQIEANLDLLPEDEDPTDIRPFKVWLRSGNIADAAAPAIRVHDLKSTTSEFLQMSEAIEKYGDEVTTIPRYMWGDNPGSGAGRTASGLSMMMGSANITIKDQVKNFDDGITKPFITSMYHWNMQFNEDESIKGDYEIVATGSSSLIAKEVYANSLMQFANIAGGEIYAPYIKHGEVLRSLVKVLDLDDKGLVKTRQEVEIERQQQAQQEAELQEFMTQITEAARDHGISPKDLLAQGEQVLSQIKRNEENNVRANQGQ